MFNTTFSIALFSIQTNHVSHFESSESSANSANYSCRRLGGSCINYYFVYN
ncbi:hypothetical protein X777_12344 [Ooceraea biroi]|uniref:Uncharacterized protein n=1 Tax=Ooceraea biroi TaxID=2015173 RepID=A0A026W2Q5_OOCBI|nr:hypothetical protein X777_12344 [Ooceraea biroi]